MNLLLQASEHSVYIIIRPPAERRPSTRRSVWANFATTHPLSEESTYRQTADVH